MEPNTPELFRKCKDQTSNRGFNRHGANQIINLVPRTLILSTEVEPEAHLACNCTSNRWFYRQGASQSINRIPTTLILSTGVEPELNFKLQNVDFIDNDTARASFWAPRLNLELPGFIWDLLPKVVHFLIGFGWFMIGSSQMTSRASSLEPLGAPKHVAFIDMGRATAQSKAPER